MRHSRVASRYALALYQQAEQDKALDAVAADMSALKTTLAESRELLLFFRSPVIKAGHKAKVIEALCSKSQASAVMRNFLLLLVEKKRENEIDQIAVAFEVLRNDRQGLAPVEVVSAMELDAEQKTKLLAAAEKIIGKKPLPTYSVNPALIGGFTIQFGDSVLDGSIKRQLAILRQRLREGAFKN